jgi:hypothetical protein
MPKTDTALRSLFAAIASGDDARVSSMLADAPALARASLQEGATRQGASANFLEPIGRYIWTGDTALHIAAGAYRADIVQALVAAAADVRARNRLGDEPLHSASVGQPASLTWNPAAQAATIVALIQAGADPNALNKTGVAPLHRAVRTRCAAAVETLLECGADPALRNKSGSTPLRLATLTTGRGGSGSPEARLQQQHIMRLLEHRR